MHRLHYFFNNKIVLIFIFSLIIFIAKWYIFVFSESNLEIKILFNYIADSKYWVPYIKFISELTLNNSFDPEIKNLKNLPIPIGSLFIYSIFYKLFGLYSLIVVEFLSLFLFLLIFYKIFQRFCDENISLFFSLLLISLPGVFDYLGFDLWAIKNTLNNLYSLRIHRPVFSNIFFLTCIYLLVKEIQEDKIKEKNILILSFIMGLLFSSFYYFFIIIFLSLSFILLYKIKFRANRIKKHLNLIIKSSAIFVVTSLPFILNLYFHENDVSKGAGLISLNTEKKILILEYFLGNFAKLEFLLIFFIISVITFFFRKNIHHRVIILFYIIFICSVFSPIFFISLSPSSGLIYHFNNNILLCIFLFTFILLILFFKNIVNKNKLLYFFSTLLILFNIYQNFSISLKNQNFLENDDEIKEFKQIKNSLEKDFKNSFKSKGILTFDTNFMIWAILNDFKFINIINHMWVPKKHKMIENDLVKNFFYLNLREKDFEKFLYNNFAGWRYYNHNLGEIFGYRYQANSLVTKKNEKFDNIKMNKFIQNSKPNLNQQIAISLSEKKRLIDLLKKNRDNPRIPEFIIISLKKEFLKNYKINIDLYCNNFQGKYYSLYYLKDLSKCKK